MNLIKKYLPILVILIAIMLLVYLIPYTSLIKLYILSIVIFILYLIKLLFFDYVSLSLIYKKAKETATGAGMILISISIIIFAILNTIN